MPGHRTNPVKSTCFAMWAKSPDSLPVISSSTRQTAHSMTEHNVSWPCFTFGQQKHLLRRFKRTQQITQMVFVCKTAKHYLKILHFCNVCLLKGALKNAKKQSYCKTRQTTMRGAVHNCVQCYLRGDFAGNKNILTLNF